MGGVRRGRRWFGAAVGVETGGKRDTQTHRHTERERQREVGSWNLEWGNVRLWDSSLWGYLFAIFIMRALI